MPPKPAHDLELIRDITSLLAERRAVDAMVSALSISTELLSTDSSIILLTLNPATHVLEQVFPNSSESATVKVEAASLLRHNEGELVSQLLLQLRHILPNVDTGCGIFLKSTYSSDVLRAVLVVTHPADVSVGIREELFFESLTHVLYLALKRDELPDTLSKIHAASFHQRERELLSDLVAVVQRSLKVSYVAIHEYDADDELLSCIAMSPLLVESSNKIDAYDIDPNAHELLRSVLSRTPDYEAVPLGEACKVIPHLRTEGVETAVIAPIYIGSRIFGTILFGSSISHYPFNSLDLSAFKAVASSIGLSIANFRSLNQAVADAAEVAFNDMAVVAVEIAQHARHEARDHIEEGQAILHNLKRTIRQSPEIVSFLDALDRKFLDLSHTMDRVKEATIAPADEYRVCKLLDVWQSAFSNFQHKLDRERVAWQIGGNACDLACIFGAQDRLRLTFSQLIVNSLDAFTTSSKQKRKDIKVEINYVHQKVRDFVIRYYDNAGGIRVEQLRLPPDQISPTAIFRRGVTSKGKAGAGYGLFLVRKTLADMGGSIDLIEYRGGVTIFEIKLPKAQTHEAMETAPWLT